MTGFRLGRASAPSNRTGLHGPHAGGGVSGRNRAGLAAALAAAAVAAVLVLGGGVTARAQSNTEPEEFSAFAVNMGARTAGSTASLVITVNRWTSQTERDQLFTRLREKGMEAFLDALQRARSVGTIRTTTSIGYDLRLALEEPGKDGGRRILIATDRPVSFYEATSRPPSIDYPFTVIEMHVKDGEKGEGTMSVAARIVPAGRTLLVENFDTQPVRLSNIESRKLTRR